jgi:hypothetical protein
MRNANKFCIGKPQGKQPCGSHRRRCDCWRALVSNVMKLRGYINGGDLLDYLSDYQLLKQTSAPWS